MALAVSSCLGSGVAMAGAGPNSVTIPSNGQQFSIVIDSPADGTEVLTPPGIFTVEGRVSLGSAVGTPTNVVYVIDVSGSTGTNTSLDCNGDGGVNMLDDINGDGRPGTILDCELAGVLALHQSLYGAVNVTASVIVFAGISNAVPNIENDAKIADVQPLAGQQDSVPTLEHDGNGNSVPDLEEAVRSATVRLNTLTDGGIRLFTHYTVGSLTNYAAAVKHINDLFDAHPGERNIAYFFSDGVPQFSTNPNLNYLPLLSYAATAGTVINTFSVGPSGPGCSSGHLHNIAATTGGTCTQVTDPSDLVTAAPGNIPAGLDHVEVNGTTASVDALGNFSADLTCPSVNPAYAVNAVGFANDPDSTTVAADVTVNCKPPNDPPVADAGPDQVLECTSPSGAVASFDGSGSSDPNGDPLSYAWTSAFGNFSGVTGSLTMPLGSNSVQLTVTDPYGASDSDSTQVTVQDTQGPTMSLTASPDTLWSANHKMVPVQINATASDVCSTAVSCQVVSVTSNQPVNGSGDGNTGADWQITGDLSVALRAERAGTLGERVYTITAQCSDDHGNTTTGSVDVKVPANQGKKH